MSVIGASLSFTSFTDDFIAWNSRVDLQEFFESIRVPVGTLTTFGTFKKVVAEEFSLVELENSDVINIIVDGVSAGMVPTRESFDELKAAFVALQESYNSLLVKLRTAKILDE